MHPLRSSSTFPPSWTLSRWLFLRLLALVHLIAFVSLWVQIEGLVGSGGLLPVGTWLDGLHDRLGTTAYRLAPTLVWLAPGDASLHALCAAGVVLSLLLAAGVAPRVALAGLWVSYLSLVVAGQVFFNFQWDMLLLETTLAALFWAPPGWWRPVPWGAARPRRLGRWLLWAVLVKLMVLSGAVKLLSLDETWWARTALEFHYWTQPLPTWLAWLAHTSLPQWVHQASLVVMFVIECLAPLGVVCGRWLRRAAALALIALQVAIAATGNYGFFNLLAVVLCVPLLDDDALLLAVPRRWRRRLAGRGSEWPPRRRWSRPFRIAAVAAGGVLLLASGLSFVDELVATGRRAPLQGTASRAVELADRWVVAWADPWILRPIRPFRSVNGYGLFRRMTTTRPEIIVEGSDDGRTWHEYTFRWKPGDPHRRPRFVAPHMPRLDWQMWFAALGPQRALSWLQPLLWHLLHGTPEVTGLLGQVPSFEGGRPRWVRLVAYTYEFSTPAQRRQRGVWWTRTRVGPLTRPLSLEAFEGPGRPRTADPQGGR